MTIPSAGHPTSDDPPTTAGHPTGDDHPGDADADAPVVHRYRTSVRWDGSTGVGYERYGRGHTLRTDPPTVELELSSDPSFQGDPSRLNPEELLVAAASSCQLLSFLAIAARARLDVVDYTDAAVGEMPTDRVPISITRITLRPAITIAVATGGTAPSLERVRRLVDLAHHECYIASSLRTEVVVEPTFTFVDTTA
jgi:organic hydroperoxide reductase OsmC/OhrA